MFDKDVVRCAEMFWKRVGKCEQFPRTLETPISWALPIAIVKLPELGLKEIHQWLQDRNIALDFRTPNRKLRACLVAKAGKGIIFLDGCDDSDEQRLSLAHELAHYLRDYLEPREKVLSCFGETISDVLDGHRLPTPEERLKGIFNGVSIGTFTDLLDRSSSRNIHRASILEKEDFADQLALELLAPHQVVISRLNELGIKWKDKSATDMCVGILINDYGIPRDTANIYGNMLVMTKRQSSSFRDWIGVRSA